MRAQLMAAVLVAASSAAQAQDCDPNYDPCVPVASDVDCAGGSGNGPVYVEGPVTVVGEDIYRLDRDGDGPRASDFRRGDGLWYD
jgi:resuscitation-promoting factor RpfB